MALSLWLDSIGEQRRYLFSVVWTRAQRNETCEHQFRDNTRIFRDSTLTGWKAMNLWQRKLLAFLHDPPSKCADIRTHEERSERAMHAAGFSEELCRAFSKLADITASSADRFPFPRSGAANLSCHFDGLRAGFHHPLGGNGAVLTFEQPVTGFDAIEGVEQAVQPVLNSWPPDWTEDELWRARFFAHWRLWPTHAAVGTGTAGKHSDVAQGLANTIRQVRPRKFWLVPSASEKSIPVADLIRETVADLGSFARWSESTAYHAIPNHDDIHECRRFAREVIAVAKLELRAEERWVVNPTSGTKQMSAGATLAALDEEVDQIDFTCGERVDGVVETGTEVVQSFDLRGFLFQRDLNGTMLLTAQRAWDTLATAQDPMADAYFADQKLQAGLQLPNESTYGHGNEPVDAARAQAVADRLRNLLREQMPLALACWTTTRRPHLLA